MLRTVLLHANNTQTQVSFLLKCQISVVILLLNGLILLMHLFYNSTIYNKVTKILFFYLNVYIMMYVGVLNFSYQPPCTVLVLVPVG